VHLALDRDAFAEGMPISYDEGLSHVRYTLENHATSAHLLALALMGLPSGGYRLIVDGKRQPEQAAVDGALTLQVPISGNQVAVEVIRIEK
jgi:hypothetical protein